MEVKVKLYGTLRSNVPDYKPSQGIVVEIPTGTTVRELLDHLEIPGLRGAVVIADGHVLKIEDQILDGLCVNIFQSIQGG